MHVRSSNQHLFPCERKRWNGRTRQERQCNGTAKQDSEDDCSKSDGQSCVCARSVVTHVSLFIRRTSWTRRLSALAVRRVVEDKQVQFSVQKQARKLSRLS